MSYSYNKYKEKLVVNWGHSYKKYEVDILLVTGLHV